MLAGFNVLGLPAGNTGCQMGGWFRQDIKTPDDVRGLKFRIGGLAGQVWQKVGAVRQQIAAGDIYPALERGTIDAAEWIGPLSTTSGSVPQDRPSSTTSRLVGGRIERQRYREPGRVGRPDQAVQGDLALRGGLGEPLGPCQVRHREPAGVAALGSPGRPATPLLARADGGVPRAEEQLYVELSAKDAVFKRLHDHLRAFREEAYLWYQVADYSFDTFQIRSRGKG